MGKIVSIRRAPVDRKAAVIAAEAEKAKHRNAAVARSGRITRPDQAYAAAVREAAERAAAAPAESLRAVVGEGDHDAHLQERAAIIAAEDPDNAPPEPVLTKYTDGSTSFDLAARAELAQSFVIPLRFLTAALITAGNQDVRYYLNGVYLHAVAGEVRIVSTDGHRLLVSRYVPPAGCAIPAWAEAGVVLPRDELTQALPLLVKNGVLGMRHAHEEPIATVEQTGETITLRAFNGFASFTMRPVDGKFPDYQKVLAGTAELLAGGEREALEATAINAKYIRGATDIAAKLGAISIHSFIGRPEQACLFTFEGSPDTVLIIMPIRGGPSVSDSAIKLLGNTVVAASVAALKAHATRTAKLLAAPGLGSRERQDLEARKSGFESRIANLLAASANAPKQLSHQPV